MIRRSLARRLEHLEARLRVADEPLVIQSDASRRTAPQLTAPGLSFRVLEAAKLNVLGLPAAVGPPYLVDRIAKACPQNNLPISGLIQLQTPAVCNQKIAAATR